MLRSIVLRLLLASTLMATYSADVPGDSPSSAAAQETQSRPLLGFAAKLPDVYSQYDLATTYGFRWLTPENAMKMETIGGCDGVYDFGPSDALLAVANDLGMQMHGHTLVWHKQASRCADAYTKADFREYIQTVARHYCGKIPSIDVVNEALGKYTGFHGSGESVWQRLFDGNDYIVTAFKWARRTCPEMKLYYNDYGIEFGPKSDEMLDLVRMLDDKGLIDGVGFQSHLKLGAIDLAGFAATMDAVSAMGLEIAISELDIRFGRNYWELSAADLHAQAEAYRQIAQLCFDRLSCVRFTTWGLDDGTSWVNHWPEFGPYDDAPLLFDRLWFPKPAYCTGVRPVFDLPLGECGVGS